MDAILTSTAVDLDYQRICSQIGDAWCRRHALEAQLDAVDAQLENLMEQRSKYVAQYQVLAHNEKNTPVAEHNVTPIKGDTKNGK
jgi:flagellin-like hook-associated protein FlgL